MLTVFGSAPAADSRARTLGVTYFSGSLATAARLVVDRACAREGGYACLGGAHVLVSAQHDLNLRRALDGAWAVFPDGAPVAWLQRRSGFRRAERVGGPDLMALVCAEGVAANLRHFLLGSTDGVLGQLQRNLERDCPGSAIVGSYSPSREEIDGDGRALVKHVGSHHAQIVWCAFGAPRQELWMARTAPGLSSSLLVGVGAAFDFIAGAKPRAPRWMQRAGLEWAHRLGTEPRRLAGRYARTNSEFILRAAAELLRGEKR